MSPGDTQTIHLSITAYGLWQMKLGVKNVAFVMREGTLKDLVAALAKAKGADLEETISAKGGLASGLTVFVNGAAVQDLGTRLREGDEVVLSSAFDGG